MNWTKLPTVACMLLAVAGCATRASGVAPIAISASDYNGLNCAESREALAVAQQREWALTKRQNNAAVADAAAVFLVALPLGSVFGGDVAGELAQAKGEALALQRRVTNACRSEYVAPAATPASAPAPAPVAAATVAPQATPSTARPAPAPAAATRQCGVRSLTNPGAVSC